jgi:hypothetical protein
MAEDVERILKSKIKEVAIAAIGIDRPFMDVPDVAEQIAIGIVELLKRRDKACPVSTADNEVVVSIHGGNA